MKPKQLQGWWTDDLVPHLEILLATGERSDEGLLGTKLFQGCKVELDSDADVVSFRKKPVRKQ
ncbi:MAG: hypothetical protein HOP19_15225 [Acidobacteria bacterium]|nr:hypothetical protein [Acidobacteriota bacterium]